MIPSHLLVPLNGSPLADEALIMIVVGRYRTIDPRVADMQRPTTTIVTHQRSVQKYTWIIHMNLPLRDEVEPEYRFDLTEVFETPDA